MNNLRNKVLIAAKSFKDPSWRQTVILIITDMNNIQTGLILNKRCPVTIREAFLLHPKKIEVNSDQKLMYGGPCPYAPVLFHQCYRYRDDEGQQAFEGIYFASDTDKMVSLINDGEWHRIFSGYSGWSPGQLKREISQGNWHIGEFDEYFLTAEDDTDIWPAAIKKFGEATYSNCRIKTNPNYSLN
jgi:putative transcriptional regulator